jgi:hypothetical protein
MASSICHMATDAMLQSPRRTRRGLSAGIAAAITEVLGRKISYQPLTIPQYRERLEKAGLSGFMIQHFCAVALDYQSGIFSGEDKIIAELTGKPPMPVQDFVASRSLHDGER